jgi:hypothetical protein
VGRAERLGDEPLELGLHGNDVELAHRTVDLLHDGGRQVHADSPRELLRIRDGGGELRQALDDGAHVSDVHAFLEQQLQHLLQGSDADHLRHHVLHQLGRELGDVLDELLRLDPAEQARRVQLHRVREVRGDHGRAVDHGEARHLRRLALRGLDPRRRQAERGIDRRRADERRRGDAPGIDGEEHPRERLAFTDDRAAQQDPVALGFSSRLSRMCTGPEGSRRPARTCAGHP